MKAIFRGNNKRVIIFLLPFLFSKIVFSQGRDAVFLMGYHDAPTSNEARFIFTDTSYSLSLEQRVIPFVDTQGNIADENGNLLMSSNGVFIADATGDTMMNGGGLNPGWLVDNYSDGIPMPYANLFLPVPGDSNKYILFHQVADISINFLCKDILFSVISFSSNPLGEVISKNNIALTDTFSWGFAACKHGNGRDWWISALSKDATGLHTFLLSPDTLQYMGLQTFPSQIFLGGYTGQPSFSPDGTKFAFAGSYGINGMNYQSSVTLFNFDRCDGTFTLDTVIDFSDNYTSFASAFSPNSKYLYFASVQRLYQYDTDTGNPYQLVAVNDTFLSAPPVFFTDFFQLYLAANGKIYISSGSSVLDLHEMDFPDSAGVSCNVNLHNIHTNCFFIGVPNHPNYYLGRLVGSPCDTLTSINDPPEHDFRFKVFPNPVMDGNIKIMYLLPQNKSGKLEIYDVTGKVVYSQNLPPWSTIQDIALPHLANGIYNVVVKSAVEWESKKIIVFKE
ncbi:MAG: T9SS type A sorting domain-containing protein [Bacteroidia bacterium]|nr:T9SS type A sorting domain-containing protein [Bacteroidota bacterium]MBP9081736.1 T9SS type A sorting domain-containing protein [Bacteroidia bacterium]